LLIGQVLENEPVERRADVVSAVDANSGVDEMIAMRKGYARDLAGFWSAPAADTASADNTGPRRPIELPRGDEGESAVRENEPQRLEGVVRADDPNTQAVDDTATIVKGVVIVHDFMIYIVLVSGKL